MLAHNSNVDFRTTFAWARKVRRESNQIQRRSRNSTTAPIPLDIYKWIQRGRAHTWISLTWIYDECPPPSKSARLLTKSQQQPESSEGSVFQSA